MRVISGELRGKRLKTLEGLDVRPTTDRIKEAVFSILQFDLPGACFLDLFAGSGQNGIEALSRGAKQVFFVDQSKQAINVICENLKAVGKEHQAKVTWSDAKSFLMKTTETFDLVFLDPPYHQNILDQVLPLVAEKMAKTGVIVCEHEKNEEIPEVFCDFHLKKRYQYGKLMLSSFTVPQNEEE